MDWKKNRFWVWCPSKCSVILISSCNIHYIRSMEFDCLVLKLVLIAIEFFVRLMYKLRYAVITLIKSTIILRVECQETMRETWFVCITNWILNDQNVWNSTHSYSTRMKKKTNKWKLQVHIQKKHAKQNSWNIWWDLNK